MTNGCYNLNVWTIGAFIGMDGNRSRGRILTARSVSVSEALSPLAPLALPQYVLSFIEIRSTLFKRFVKSEPSLLVYNGDFVKRNLRKEKILKKDLLSVVRRNHFDSLEEIETIVLETDGVVCVIKKSGKTGNKMY